MVSAEHAPNLTYIRQRVSTINDLDMICFDLNYVIENWVTIDEVCLSGVVENEKGMCRFS